MLNFQEILKNGSTRSCNEFFQKYSKNQKNSNNLSQNCSMDQKEMTVIIASTLVPILSNQIHFIVRKFKILLFNDVNIEKVSD